MDEDIPNPQFMTMQSMNSSYNIFRAQTLLYREIISKLDGIIYSDDFAWCAEYCSPTNEHTFRILSQIRNQEKRKLYNDKLYSAVYIIKQLIEQLEIDKDELYKEY